MKDVASPYYWVKDRETNFLKVKKIFVEEGDELLEEKVVKNGNIEALDLKIKKVNSHYIQKVRYLVNGRDIYTLAAIIPEADKDKTHHNQFFDDFRLKNEITPGIYVNQAGVLMDALLTGDSIVFAQAKQELENVEFSKEDLGVLHTAVLKIYRDTGEYNEVKDQIISEIINLEDRASVDFVLSQYVNPEIENDPYQLLGILARMQNDYSYTALKSLLAKGPPKGKETWSFERGIKDSLELTRTLLPEMLANLRDSVFVEAVYDVIDQMIDSNIISLEEVNPYKKVFLKQAGYLLASLQKDHENWYSGQYWLPLLSKWNDRENNDLIRQFLKLPPLGLKRHAIRELLKNGQVVPASEILLLAKDTLMRYLLYRDLVELKKTSLMPIAYATQKSISESELYYYASDETEINSINFLGEQVEAVSGKQIKYFLFRVDFKTDTGLSSYLGITGPYEINAKQMVTDSKTVGIYWEEEFDRKKFKEQFKKFIKGLE